MCCAAVAGGGWQGKKVTFGEDGAADGDAEQGNTAAAAASAGEQGAEQQQTQKDPSAAAEPKAKRSKARSSSDAGAGADGSAGSAKCKVKWGALAVQQLQGARDGGLKWKKLWPLLLAAAVEQQRQQKKQGLKVKEAVGESSKDKAWQKLQSCSKLCISGKLVTLAAA